MKNMIRYLLLELNEYLEMNREIYEKVQNFPNIQFKINGLH